MKRTTFPWLVIKRDISLESVGSGRCLISPVLWRGKLCLTWTPWSCKGTPGQIKVYIKYLLNNIEWEVHNLNVSVSSVTASTESHCPCWWVLWHSDISLIPEAHCINSYPTLFKQLLCMGETHSSFRFSMNESVTFSLFSQKLQQEAIRKRQVQTVKWTGFRRRLLITRFSLQTNAWFTQISTSKDDIKSSYSLEYFVLYMIQYCITNVRRVGFCAIGRRFLHSVVDDPFLFFFNVNFLGSHCGATKYEQKHDDNFFLVPKPSPIHKC